MPACLAVWRNNCISRHQKSRAKKSFDAWKGSCVDLIQYSVNLTRFSDLLKCMWNVG